MDKTYKDEKNAMTTSARFVQLGFFGALRFGSNKIDIYSPSNGYQILSLRKVGINLPPYVPFSLGSIVTPESDSIRTNTNIQQIYYNNNDYSYIQYYDNIEDQNYDTLSYEQTFNGMSVKDEEIYYYCFNNNTSKNEIYYKKEIDFSMNKCYMLFGNKNNNFHDAENKINIRRNY